MVVLCKVSHQGFHTVCLVSSIMTQAVISFKRACAQFACPQLIGCYGRLIGFSVWLQIFLQETNLYLYASDLNFSG